MGVWYGCCGLCDVCHVMYDVCCGVNVCVLCVVCGVVCVGCCGMRVVCCVVYGV